MRRAPVEASVLADAAASVATMPMVSDVERRAASSMPAVTASSEALLSAEPDSSA